MPSITPTTLRIEPRGAALDLLRCYDPEVLISGPAGTGKSFVALFKLHHCLLNVPNLRVLAVRKTLQSLTETGLVTYREKILHPSDHVQFFGGSREKPPAFNYENGAQFLVGGLDRSSKHMSAEYDLIYVQEALELTEDDWEALSTRLRNGVLAYQQILADCNPGAPTHWLKRRCDDGRTTLLESRHEDNPQFWQDGDWTPAGKQYIARLDDLTGVRLARLRYGRWAAAEGVVYDTFDRAVHVVDRFEIPASWRRFRAIDFGFTNPFVCQWWAMDPDGRLYLYRELYQTQTLVSDLADRITALSDGEFIEATVADHDAEGRATLLAHGIQTVPAKKEIVTGIQAVQNRLAPAGDGTPRLFLLRDSLVSRDQALADAGKPCSTEQEFDSYVWAKSAEGRPIKETPVDLDNHGLDSARYLTMHADARPSAPANRYVAGPPRPEIANYQPR